MPAAVEAWQPIYRQLLREGRRLPDETARYAASVASLLLATDAVPRERRLHFRKEAKRTLKLKRDTLYDAHVVRVSKL